MVGVWLRFENGVEVGCLHSLGQLCKVASKSGKGHACCCILGG